MEPHHRSSSSFDEQVLNSIQESEKFTCTLQDDTDNLIIDHAMVEIAHLSAPPKTRSDEDLYCILVCLAAFFDYCCKQITCLTSIQNWFVTDWSNTLAALDKSFKALPYKTRIIETRCITWNWHLQHWYSSLNGTYATQLFQNKISPLRI